jgi:hypothetical protein
MPVRLARPRRFPAVEEAKKFFSIFPICLQAGVCSFKIVLFWWVCLLFKGFRSENEVIRNYGEFVEDEEVGRR